MAVLRDEAATLPDWLRALEQLEKCWRGGEIVYSIVENDSTDATPTLLQRWLCQRQGSWISERRHAPALRRGTSSARTTALADLRNLALDRLLLNPVELICVIDGGLTISVEQPLRLMHQLLAHPPLAMVAASAMQNVPDVVDGGPNSHYDSWALRDLKGRCGITFAAIPVRDSSERQNWRDGRCLAVSSAFGGMAAVRRSAVDASGARWNGHVGCEHWSFCDTLRQWGSVVVDPKVQPRVHHPHPPQWRDDYKARILQELELNNKQPMSTEASFDSQSKL